MNDSVVIEWCALGLGPCWAREEWIALWASFGGVFVAFLLGTASQLYSEKRRSKASHDFLKNALLKSMDAISHFDGEWRVFGTEEQIARSFGGLSHVAAAIKWASAHPDKFTPYFFVRLLTVEKRLTKAGDVGPVSFAGSNFVVDASTHLSQTVPAIAADIRFLLGLAKRGS